MKNDTTSLAHTTWNCKYHIVFAPKYRRKVFYGEKRLEIGAILRSLCEWKEINILEAEVCPDHVRVVVTTLIRQERTKSDTRIYRKSIILKTTRCTGGF